VADQKAETVFQQVIQEQQGEPKDEKRQKAEDHFVNFLGYNRADAKTLSEIFIKKYKK
jgi:hypothetical protein